jgi:Holliday junction resolvase RusA-like endonuclease
MSKSITFFVPGIPRPGGSKRGFVIPGTKRVVITEDCKKSKDWRTSVAWAAKEKITAPMTGPLEVRFLFTLARPKGHLNSKGFVKPSAPSYPAVRPDCTKLVRSTEDALKGIAWLDDSQIVNQHVLKHYGNPGCEITISSMNGDSCLFESK